MSRRRLILGGTALLLAVLSAAAWQFRFTAGGPALDLAFGPDSRNWTLAGGGRIARDNGTWTLPPPAGGVAGVADAALPGLEAFRFVHVRLEATWENVTRKDARSWWSARVSLGSKGADGRYQWPADGDIINASGNRGWHRVESVLDLPPTMGEPHLVINNLAATGTMKLRALKVTPVRQRGWIPAATAALLAAWMTWAAALGAPGLGRWRRLAMAGCLVAGGWYLVFPQAPYHAQPFPGGFHLGPEIESPPPASAPAVARAVADPPAPAATPLRTDHPAARVLRQVDRDLPFAHVAAFAALGLALCSLAGVANGWRPMVVLAILSETIPNLLRREFKADDAADLAANLVGVLVAVALVAATAAARRRWRERRIS